MPYKVTDKCILCGACVAGCPTGAVTIADGDTQSRINPDVCIECGTCEENCPVEAIIYVDEE
ncbi:MAG: 4Fe-4S binding protein [Anaerolineae bacterium]|nr:4Fe-4S binding protein [Anaerolineae bacterium]